MRIAGLVHDHGRRIVPLYYIEYIEHKSATIAVTGEYEIEEAIASLSTSKAEITLIRNIDESVGEETQSDE
jgi:hypothetical protein